MSEDNVEKLVEVFLNATCVDISIQTPVSIDLVSDNQSIQIELFPADSNNLPRFDDNIIK